jgi:Mlc titration factor MtfA (ptsG expression regulator)
VRAYAATNETEYFAVTSELFFTVPARLREHHPRVYELLVDFYRQSPAGI